MIGFIGGAFLIGDGGENRVLTDCPYNFAKLERRRLTSIKIFFYNLASSTPVAVGESLMISRGIEDTIRGANFACVVLNYPT